MMPQVGGHVGCQVPEAEEGPKGEVKRKSADQGKDSVELLRRKHSRNGRTNRHFLNYHLTLLVHESTQDVFFIEAQMLALFFACCLLRKASETSYRKD